jgi:hypothetical protein
MKILAILYFFLLSWGAAPGPAPQLSEPAPPSAALSRPDVCQLKGVVYVTEIPEEAHFRVFVEEYESSARLLVFSEENRLFADQPGVWHFTRKRAFSNFTIYLTDTRAFADFTIAYTDIASFAGCR